ncbi:Polysaccharide deacetylase [Aquisphaera giovannonii]|uniref:Polysaccharide deacetylase n=1 Tax=Aquisphaera giovannonii TaxID=406548 RepID=A0A5B9W8H9_9BACT|nr:polysaccharide deacetylase family protein [Aquisphaera giovannonii]QEH36385.1 Polysaccharide deacetylase [Aquisphaera giovannonii]
MTRPSSPLGRARTWLRRRVFPESLILLYHRVAELASDPFGLAVSPRNFAEQMEVLRRHASPVPLRRLFAARPRPRGSVAVTFDDGYADNLLRARPQLERLDVPATAFIIGGHVGVTGEFWWDELEGMLLRPGRLPPSLALDLDGGTYQAELGASAAFDADDFERVRGWSFADDATPSPRHALYRDLYRLLQPMPPRTLRRVMGRLRAWAGAPPLTRPDYRPLSPDELVGLGEGGLVEIGAHTRSHPLLPSLGVDRQREEIRSGKTILEEILGRRVEHFSYPYGALSPETVAEVRDAGFVAACTTREEPVRRPGRPWELPRFWVGNWGGDEFAARVRRWFSA